MPTTSHVHENVNNLSEKHYVTVVVRLLLDRRDRLVHGEIVDMDGKAQGQFVKWRGLIRTVRDYLTSRQF